MTREHGRAATPRALHYPILLLAVLAGMVGMHGLGPHDEDHSEGHVPTVIALVASDDEHDAHAQADTETDSAPSTEHGTSKHKEPSGGGPGLGECLALLGLLFALVIGAVLAARPGRPLVVLRRVRVQLLLLGRPPDPPCLHRLSILRC